MCTRNNFGFDIMLIELFGFSTCVLVNRFDHHFYIQKQKQIKINS